MKFVLIYKHRGIDEALSVSNTDWMIRHADSAIEAKKKFREDYPSLILLAVEEPIRNSAYATYVQFLKEQT